jgi:4-amino-4-deoxy-L-arabinose transferase-like glycosyltransferase
LRNGDKESRGLSFDKTGRDKTGRDKTGRDKTGRDKTSRVPTFVWMVAVALLLRVALIPFNSYLFEDLMDAAHLHSWEQGNVARALVAGHGFGSPFVSTQTSAIMPPVYPLIVAFFFKLLGIHTAASLLAVHVFDCLINSLACIPIFLMARRSFGSRTALWAGWGWAFFPYGIYFSAAWAWSTHLLMLCLCWMLYLAQDLERSPKLKLWAGFGLLAGFAALTEPSILLVVPFLLAYAAWRLARNGKQWLMPVLTGAVVAALTISPWLIRDAVLLHKFVPMRDSMGLELWMGNSGYDLRWTADQLHPLHNMNELADYNRMGEAAYMDHKARQAKAVIHEHPAGYAWLSLRRAVYLWTGYWSFDPQYLAMEPTDPENIPFATCMTLLGLSGLGFAFRRNRFEAMRYGGVLFLFPITYYFTHPEPYHMRTLDPVLVVLGCYAVLSWRSRRQQPQFESFTRNFGPQSIEDARREQLVARVSL